MLAGGSTSLMLGHLSGSRSPEQTKISQAAPPGSEIVQRPLPTEGKGGSCCNLAADVMSAFCRKLGKSALENVLARPNFAEEGLVFSSI